jgi:hypothetical protein
MELIHADGHAERDAAIEMLDRLPRQKRRRTIAADKAYDTSDFIARTRQRGFTPHVAQNTTNRASAIDGRTTRHQGHHISQRIRKRIEEPFGWIKTIGGGRKLRYIGRERNRAWFLLSGAVYTSSGSPNSTSKAPDHHPCGTNGRPGIGNPPGRPRPNRASTSDPPPESDGHLTSGRFSAPC